MIGVAATAGSAALRVVTSKWFWIALGIIIVILIVRRNWNKISGKFERDFGNYGSHNGQPIEDLTKDRKLTLEKWAQDLYTAIYTTGGNSAPLMAIALSLNDLELKYLAQHYKKAITRGTSLYTDVDDEIMPGTDVDEKLMARLAKLGERA